MRYNDTIHDFVMPNALADMPAARGAKRKPSASLVGAATAAA